jgi:hypothetical protein
LVWLDTHNCPSPHRIDGKGGIECAAFVTSDLLSRVLFLILLALNVAVAVWWATRPAPPLEAFSATDPGVAALQLLSERDDAAMASAAAAASEPAPVRAGSGQCFSTGPISSEAELRGNVEQLNRLSARLQIREHSARVIRGYSVYLPAYDSRDDALRGARQLSAAGLRDYYVVTAGDQENTISLGLFRQEENARRRLQQVQTLGFNARMSERADTEQQYWIDFNPLVEAGEDWRQVAAVARLGARPVPCF